MTRPPRPDRLLAATIALLLVAWCLREDVQPDLYFHLSAGRIVWEAGLPDRNVFLAVHQDHRFIDHEWLAQAVAWPLFAAGGAPLLTLLKTLAAAGCLAALAAACSRHGRVVRWVALIPAVLLLGSRLVLRPEVLSFACIALVLWRLQRDRFRPTRRSVLLLAAAQTLWSNSHGVSLLGPVIVAGALAGTLAHGLLRRAGRGGWLPVEGDARRLLVLLAALLGAALLNPYGPRASFYAAFHVAGSAGDPLAERVVELTSPFDLLGRWEVRLALAWAAAAPLLWLAAARARRARLEDAAIGAGLLVLGLLYVRNLPLVALGLAVPTAAGLRVLGEAALARLPEGARARARAGALVLAVVTAVVLARATLADRFHENAEHDARAGVGLGDFVVYEESARFLRESRPRGLLFNTFGAGHYLGYAGLRPFINGNVDLYPLEHRLRYYALMDGSVPWDEELRALGVTDVHLDHRVEVPAFFDAILAHPGWALVHADDHAVVLRRRDAGVVPLDRGAFARAALARSYEDEAPDRFGPTRALRAARLLPPRHARPIARLHVARLLERLGRPGDALALARRAQELAPEFAPAVLGRAELERAWGDPAAAERLYDDAAELVPDSAGPWLGRAHLAFRRGDAGGVIVAARQALAREPGSVVAAQLLLNAHEMARDPVELRRALAARPVRPALRRYYEGVAARIERDLPRAEASFREALALEPGLSLALWKLAAVCDERGDVPGAEDALRRLVEATPRDAVAWCDLGNIRQKRGDTDGALVAWQRAADVDSREVDALVAAARAVAERSPDQARGFVREALRRNPKHPDALRLTRQLGLPQED